MQSIMKDLVNSSAINSKTTERHDDENKARIHQVQVNKNTRARWNTFNRNTCRSLREGWSCYARENAHRRDSRWISIYLNRDGEEKKDDKAYASMEMDMAFRYPTEIEASNLWL